MSQTVHPAVKRLSLQKNKVDDEVQALLGDMPFSLTDEGPQVDFLNTLTNFTPESIVKGRVVAIDRKGVVVDIGAKSEGIVDFSEFSEDELKIGTEIEVMIEWPEQEGNPTLLLSKRKADRKRKWKEVLEKCHEGQVITGLVTRKIKGGLLVDIGVPVFLPASQVSLRRARDISEYIGQELECEIIKIDEARENIVVSRRKMQEAQRENLKKTLLGGLNEGDVREGIVKNIADFGAFVDLGGIDGLLHITDMSWGRIQHPSEVVSLNDEIKVKILKIDRERERIALGLKQLTSSPWEGIAERYPVSSKQKGKIVNIMSYGAFVKLEEGIEGLVHISEMSWTRRVTDPREFVTLDQEVEVVVLGVNEEKQEISLGMKQLEMNPWERVREEYQPGKKVTGIVRNLTNYGAFIEIEPGIDGLLHVSDISWTRKMSHPGEILTKNQDIECVVLSVDIDKHRIALGAKQLTEDPWERHIPEKYALGQGAQGEVTKITNFGVFVKLEEELEGLLHVSELSKENELQAGETIAVKVIRLDQEDRKIGLTLDDSQEIQASGSEETEGSAAVEAAAAPEPEASSEGAAEEDS